MNWFGKQAGQGYEYNLLVLGIAIVLTIIGAGRWSVDQQIAEKISK